MSQPSGTDRSEVVVKQTEKQFSDAVVELATLLGWKVKRDPMWRATAASPGYPDLTMTNGKQIVFAELKVGKNVPTQPQREWIALLRSVTSKYTDITVAVWTPDDWDDIEEALKR